MRRGSSETVRGKASRPARLHAEPAKRSWKRPQSDQRGWGVGPAGCQVPRCARRDVRSTGLRGIGSRERPGGNGCVRKTVRRRHLGEVLSGCRKRPACRKGLEEIGQPAGIPGMPGGLLRGDGTFPPKTGGSARDVSPKPRDCQQRECDGPPAWPMHSLTA